MQRNIRRFLITVIAATVAAGALYSCAGTKYYTEEELGIRTEPIYDEESTSPLHGEPITKQPGESDRFERAFENSPPLIPHDITGMLPLLQTENICLDCHMPEEAVGMGATSIPGSHFVDPRTGEDLKGELDGGRFSCMQCHVTQTTLSPVVENVFKGEFRNQKDRYGSNLLEILNEGVEAE